MQCAQPRYFLEDTGMKSLLREKGALLPAKRACRAGHVDMLAGSRARRDFTRAVSGIVDSAMSNIPQLRRAG